MVSCRDASSSDSPKIEEIEGRSTASGGCRNSATIALAVFFLRHRGFDRVSTGYRARDRVGPKGGRR